MHSAEIRLTVFQALLVHRPGMQIEDILSVLPKVEAAMYAASAGEMPKDQTEHENTVAK